MGNSFMGARRGEVLGLKRDRVTKTLKLSRQSQTFTVGRSPERLPKPDGFERAKSAAGVRVVPLVEPLRSILDDYMRSKERSDGDLLFAERGHPYDPDSVSRRCRGVPAAVIRPVHLTANGRCTGKYRAVTFVRKSSERRLIGHFDKLKGADSVVNLFEPRDGS